jgi:hypothetical protein
MYLDVNLEDGLKTASRNSKARHKEAVIEEAIALINRSFATSGLVSIYTSEYGRFVGHVLKHPGEEPYFDDDQTLAPLDHLFRIYA